MPFRPLTVASNFDQPKYVTCLDLIQFNFPLIVLPPSTYSDMILDANLFSDMINQTKFNPGCWKEAERKTYLHQNSDIDSLD